MQFALVFDSETEQGGWMPQRINILSQVGDVETVTSEQIMDGCLLGGFDAVVFPGGMASFYGLRKWGNDFAHTIRYFVAGGGGLLGVCGGAYIALREPAGIFGMYCNRTFALVDAKGAAPAVSILTAYLTLLNEPFPEFMSILDVNHPIIAGHQNEIVQSSYSGGPGFFDLGETVIPLAQYLEPEWGGKAAITVSTFGQGRVCLCGPHPENPWAGNIGEPCIPWLYPAMAEWVAERQIKVDYPLLPWAKPAPLPGGLPIVLGVGALTVGMAMGMKAKRGKYE